MIEKISLCHGCTGDIKCREKINELIDIVKAHDKQIQACMQRTIDLEDTALDTKQEKIGSGHTGACQEGCQCDVAKMGKQEKCQEICKHNRRGRCMQCEKEDEGKKFNGTGTMGEGKNVR